jgi:acetyl esterase/lipase
MRRTRTVVTTISRAPGTLRFLALLALSTGSLGLAGEPVTINLWPGKPPGETKELPPEADQTRPEDNLIAGRRIIKLGNVSIPQLAVYRPEKEKETGAAVVICPGGGHHILAYDLEGTEVAAWLNTLGVTGIVLKYRVPFRNPQKRWLAAVQDGQRAMSLVRSRCAEWGLDPKRLGILGFSAGGEVAGLVSFLNADRQYQPMDAVDQVSSRPDFAMLIYPGGFNEKDQPKLYDHVKVSREAPPMFFTHAFDDGVSVYNTLLLATELKKVGVAAEAHIYAAGGHGYGLRHVDGRPVTDWPKACESWMKAMAFIR